jgi:citrate lyase beta subunit
MNEKEWGPTVKTTLTKESARESLEKLREKNLEFMARYVGDSPRRQPVHTVYGGAHLFNATIARHLGELAIKVLDENAPDAAGFSIATGMARGLAEKVYPRVVEKLEREPVEDFRIDFEDGYGNRKDDEEDGHAVAAAREIARGMREKTLPPFIGIRIKPLTEELRARSLRTLDIVVSEIVLAEKKLPQNFVITLPKVQIPEQVSALVDVLEALERGLGLTPGAIPFEIMIEQTQAVFDAHGQVAMPKLIDAARGRCIGAHLGTYDYTASCNITAAHQQMLHPSCDFAKNVMQVSLGGTGIWLSDGATNVMPVGDKRVVSDAWKLHMSHTRHSLETGYYQGWDLHPAQLPARFGAIYAFFLEALPPASERLKNFVDKAAQATLVGDVFDDAATGQGLLNFFLRGINCGAIREDEALATGLTLEEIRGRSFMKILEKRRT